MNVEDLIEKLQRLDPSLFVEVRVRSETSIDDREIADVEQIGEVALLTLVW